MTILFLKSQKNTGLLDTSRNIAIIKEKEIRINPGSVISEGDVLILKGEEFAVLNPEPSLFKEYSSRTAQIIQPWDAAAIILYGGISPGKRVLESGVGSGALSAALLNALGENGSLTTVEMDVKNIENARNNVNLLKDFNNWTVVESRIEDFSTTEKFDSIILDIPEPWNAVGRLSKNLVSGGRICCYSPTYNQVEKNVAALKKSGFLVLESIELLKRDLLVRDNATRPNNDVIGHTAFMTFAVKLSGRVSKGTT